MPILSVENDNIFADLKRKDHVIFSVPIQGSAQGNRGYSLINTICEAQGMNQFNQMGENELGTVISHEDEANHVWYHAIVTHCLEDGWTDESYEAITSALNDIAMKHEDSIVRPMRTTWHARGKMRLNGDENGSIVRALEAMANSDADLAIYWL